MQRFSAIEVRVVSLYSLRTVLSGLNGINSLSRMYHYLFKSKLSYEKSLPSPVQKRALSETFRFFSNRNKESYGLNNISL
jgi:hypothetical protein